MKKSKILDPDKFKSICEKYSFYLHEYQHRIGENDDFWEEIWETLKSYEGDWGKINKDRESRKFYRCKTALGDIITLILNPTNGDVLLFNINGK